MVGLVIVSHSRVLAEGVAEVARAMGVGRAVVECAGGDTGGGLGTSIDLVERAVRAADGGDGVVLLADLGSSVLTAKMYVEGADGKVVLADAPLVEGAVAAASMAATGAGLDAVLAAAESARDHRKT
ncbi:PTS-dependent dihydroxyacetone kinase phosphotransferase subunit DhaM [Actinomadura rudentiformis]|uniref:Phosphoenolpyruvate--protein phosphotransferase n=1 Tax=Actinomadura rudentiformis TaxID=359158 RepID=A0A6H9YTV7_9ACTN|nr:phosphoenolpyruvate--protein phosphotransferase [Actinomadura rudentiformis]KAB2351714.1 phosphoenolpyruvate--protein phosphotransferase [Actinomadura rudentiformis]